MAERLNPAETFNIPADPEQVRILDEYLLDMVNAVKHACDTAMAHQKDDSPVSIRAIYDATEILKEIMDGKVEEWVE